MGLQTLKPRLQTLRPVTRVAKASDSRITGYTLQKIRGEYLRLHPLCVECSAQGEIRKATEVDHIIPLWAGGQDAKANLEHNRQALCYEHHNAKSAKEAAQRNRGIYVP